MKRILVANDLGANSANALARAIRIAAQAGAELRILHVAVEAEELEACPSTHRRIETEARIMAEELGAPTLDISVAISGAAPANAIVREAERFNADLIVIAAHGEPRLRDAIFGTTGTHVVRFSPCPALVVQTEDWQPYAKALIAIDDTGTAPAICGTANEVAPAAELFAVHAFFPTLGEAVEGEAAFERDRAHDELEMTKVLAAVRPGQGPAPAAGHHAIVATGDVLDVLMDQAEALAPDLIVMGTRPEATYLGSHAVDALFWSTRDVLVVPEREHEAVSA